MRKIRVSSLLPASFRAELERIVFFNPKQGLVTAPLLESVRRYGVPSIVEEDGRLRFRVSAFGLLQTLYAFDDSETPSRLIGVAMFTRVRRSSAVVIHVAVHEDYAAKGKWSGTWAVSYLIAAIRDACLRTRGIHTLHVLYPEQIRLRLRPGRAKRAAPASRRAARRR